MQLRLSRRADYAVRAVLALTEEGRLLPASELARRMDIPPKFLPQIMSALVKKRILLRTLGRHGGYVLARPAHEISVLEVIQAADGEDRMRSCVLRSVACLREGPCAVHPAISEAREAQERVLAAADFGALARAHEDAVS